ncbi:dihydroxyacetone kinase subunit DhaK [Williamsoniiplasma luminosum]|uniref:Dihydroxyacetone kinase subunit DhaK n=1 Tax=Williamsoniiplasma luminosum TaxID=214888 RepID=A0A2K8NUK8_9MOLU|nr:dihydroxyacetone kinase subunit DhaK [Williamsoniiplasma luminosum]ATZ17454.1 dihydroxyacetone kinase subunit DhaK [Williamsoniiplasma luminosum]
MKKFINKIDDIVTEVIEGLVLANPEILSNIPDSKVITRKSINKNKVALISGGGSGHEPAHAGFVGTGMLDAAVFGEIFTSPGPDRIYDAIKTVVGKPGGLILVKNYTGDVMNFEIAADMAKDEGINLETVIINDDIALENSTSTTGKRGIIGTIFVHKIAGAAAEAGLNLQEVKRIAQKAIDNIASFGVSLSGCTVPASGKPGLIVPDGEMEVGLGIHGEPGLHREKQKTADESAEIIMQHIDQYLNLKKGDEVGLIVNGLGGTPMMELNILARKAIKILQAKEIKIIKSFVGNYMTAIDMVGFSFSVIKLDAELKKFLKAKVVTTAMVGME